MPEALGEGALSVQQNGTAPSGEFAECWIIPYILFYLLQQLSMGRMGESGTVIERLKAVGEALLMV